MQNTTSTPATPAATATVATPAVANVSNATATETPAAKPAKQAKRKAVAKPAATVTATPAVAAVAKPDESTRNAERDAATVAIAAYYSGRSLPLKSASDTFAPLRLDKPAKAATERQAALLAVLLAADTAGNIKPNGEFTRGGFRVPARLINPQAKASDVLAVQPETGCTSDMLNRVIFYVSGPTTGKQQRETVLRIDLAKARAEISANLGDKLAKPALAVLAKLAKQNA